MSTEEPAGLEFILTLSCPDKPGIVYAVSSFLVQHSANIITSQQFGEPDGGLFFMRVHFSVPPPGRQTAEPHVKGRPTAFTSPVLDPKCTWHGAVTSP